MKYYSVTLNDDMSIKYIFDIDDPDVYNIQPNTHNGIYEKISLSELMNTLDNTFYHSDVLYVDENEVIINIDSKTDVPHDRYLIDYIKTEIRNRKINTILAK